MTELSSRLGLPYLTAGQAQKEVTHNEALMRLDMLVQAVVVEVGNLTPPTAPAVGQAWIVGSTPTGVWSGQALAIAGWTEGGWRFTMPQEGMQCWSLADQLPIRFAAGIWIKGSLTAAHLKIGGQQVVGSRQPAIPNPTGGALVDLEARVAIDAILASLRTHGLILS